MTTRTADELRFEPDYASAPGETLADLLEEREMTQVDLAGRLGVSLKHLNQVVNGKAPVSAELALGLEKVFGVSARFWLNREALYQSHLATQEEQSSLEDALDWARKFPIAELKARGFIPTQAKGGDLVAALLRFLGVASPDRWADATVAFRKSQKWESDQYALAAWLRVGEIEARKIPCESYDADRFREALVDARSLTRLHPEEWAPALVEGCAQAGVAVVIVDTFEKARANGATRWLSPTKAVIQLSLRHRWEDIFWFSFFHESGHVLNHRKKDVFVEPERLAARQSGDPEQLRLEREADEFAARSLIPPRYERMLVNVRNQSDVIEFADRLGIAPAIVVGRLHHEKLWPHTHGNKLRRRLVFAQS